MSALPPVDREKNRELIAQRQGWPVGAVEVCRELENAYPRWTAFWTRGGLPRDRDPGYRAILKQHLRTIEVYAATAEELRAEVANADAEHPPDKYGR